MVSSYLEIHASPEKAGKGEGALEAAAEAESPAGRGALGPGPGEAPIPPRRAPALWQAPSRAL